MIVADSDVLIDALAGREPAAQRVRAELASGALATTVVTVFELLSGAATTKVRNRIERLFAALTILPLHEGAGRRAADIRRELEAEGSPIGMADYLIAGVCLSRSAALLTRNRGHFERVPGLVLAQL